MIIVWGTKVIRRRLGVVADFCSICRGIQTFRLISVQRVKHLYGVSLGGGDLLGQERVCLSCGTISPTQDTRYHGLADRPGMDLDALVQRTNPRLKEALADRLKLEQRLQGRVRLAPEERAELILEPFATLSYMIEDRAREMQVDRRCVLGLLASCGMLTILVVTSTSLTGAAATAATFTAAALGAAALIYSVHALATHLRYFFLRQVQPKLVQALLPLNPSVEELASAAQILSDHNLRISRLVRPDVLHYLLQETRGKTATGF